MAEEHFSIMAVFAHPDDESFGPASTLAKYAALGVKTYLVCATRGEKGEVRGEEGALSMEEVGRMREKELRCAAEAINLADFRVLGYPDGGLQEMDFQELTGGIVAAVRELKPQVLITFGPEGITGHSDHIVVGRATEEAFRAASDPQRFSGGIFGDREPHSPSKLYFYVLPQRMVKAFNLNLRGTEDNLVTTEINVSGFEDVRARAIRCHWTQLEPAHKKHDRETDGLKEEFLSINYFRLAASRLSPPSGLEKDLFAGLEA